jgi:hypothetical protein
VIVVVDEPLALVVLVVLSATLAPFDVVELSDELESLEVGAVVIANRPRT